jgi:hypothetical protein
VNASKVLLIFRPHDELLCKVGYWEWRISASEVLVIDVGKTR